MGFDIILRIEPYTLYTDILKEIKMIKEFVSLNPVVMQGGRIKIPRYKIDSEMYLFRHTPFDCSIRVDVATEENRKKVMKWFTNSVMPRIYDKIKSFKVYNG